MEFQKRVAKIREQLGRKEVEVRPKVTDMQKIKVEALKKTKEMYSDRSIACRWRDGPLNVVPVPFFPSWLSLTVIGWFRCCWKALNRNVRISPENWL